jgi:hypothetical protein
VVLWAMAWQWPLTCVGCVYLNSGVVGVIDLSFFLILLFFRHGGLASMVSSSVGGWGRDAIKVWVWVCGGGGEKSNGRSAMVGICLLKMEGG